VPRTPLEGDAVKPRWVGGMIAAQGLRVAPWLRNLGWTSVSLPCTSKLVLPEASGVYAYGEVCRVGGLPASVTWLYVGKTSTSIRQRVLSGHHPDRESNHSLRDWLRVAKSGELWFATLPAEAVDSVESHLIRQLQPAFNVRKKVSVHVA